MKNSKITKRRPESSRASAALKDEDRELLSLLGQIIRGRRIEIAMTQKEVADRMLIGQATVARIEEGDPRVAMGYYLGACRLVGVSLLEPADMIKEAKGLDSTRRRASNRMSTDDRFS